MTTQRELHRNMTIDTNPSRIIRYAEQYAELEGLKNPDGFIIGYLAGLVAILNKENNRGTR